jgi:outer membrane protein assembly factor BamD (BamD/ComL family)
MFKPLTTKNKLTYLIIAIVLVIAITIGTIVIVKTINDNNNKSKNQTTAQIKASANTAKTKAIEALKNKDNTKAKTLFEQANEQYKTTGDTNNVVDTNAQLCLLGEKSYCNGAATE